MTRRLDQIPIYEERRTAIPADSYNQVRLAMRRLGSPLRVPLPGLRRLDVELSDDAWVCVDASLGDLPVIAWSDFGQRRALHEPVPCRLRLYHQHAGLILDKVMAAVKTVLAERLAGAGPS